MTTRARSRSRRRSHRVGEGFHLEARIAPTVFTVLNTADAGAGSLRAMLAAADSDTSAEGGVIQFAPALAGGTISLSTVGDGQFGPSGLLVAATGGAGSGRVTIDGGTGGATITRAGTAPPFRLFAVQAGASLTLNRVTLTGGFARGGDGGDDGGNFTGGGGGAAGLGGAVYNAGTLSVVASTLAFNLAVGGNGGIGFSHSSGDFPPGAPSTGGGGGGLGGAGTSAGPGGPPNGGGIAGAGGFGGGGGGAVINSATGTGGAGGFGGGGGGAVINSATGTGGAGGFGGGGGGSPGTGGPAGLFGGAGDLGGGGGAGIGGAIFNQGGTVSLINSTLTANTARGGDGGFNDISPGTTGFAAGGRGVGGALFNLNGTVTITSSTIANNVVTGGAGVGGTVNGQALYNLSATVAGVAGGTGTTTLVASILSDPTGDTDLVNDKQPTGAAILTATAPNLVHTSANLGGTFNGGGIIVADPALGPLANYGGPTPTLPLTLTSPAVNAGGPSSAGPATDQRGFPRTGKPALDLGSFALRSLPSIVFLSSSVPFAAPGQAVTLTAMVLGGGGLLPTPTGAITFVVGNTMVTQPLVNDVAQVTFGAGPGGGLTATANYGGDANFVPSSSPITVPPPLATTISLTSSVARAAPGQAILFTVVVGGGGGDFPAPTGTVTFRASDGTVTAQPLVPVISPTATTGQIPVTPGSSMAQVAFGQSATGLTVTATYSGDPDFSTNAAALTVPLLLTPTVGLTSSVALVGPGQPVTFTATVGGGGGTLPGPTGSVTFRSSAGGTTTQPLVNGVAQVTFGGTFSGLAVLATYNGDATFFPGTAFLLVSPLQTPAVSLSSSIFPALPGKPLTFTAIVTPGWGTLPGPTGTVTFFVSDGETATATLVNGTAQATFTAPAAGGGLAVSAAYSGDARFFPGSAALVVPPAILTPVVALTSTSFPAAPGQPITFVVTIAGVNGLPTPTGTVTFFSGNGETSVQQLVAGTARVTFGGPNGGVLGGAVRYSGDANYVSSAATLIVPVLLPAIALANFGLLPYVSVLNADGTPRFVIQAYDPFQFNTGVQAAAGNVLGNGVDSIIAVPCPGEPSLIHVYDGFTGLLTRSFYSYPSAYTGGVNLSVGDLRGDGRASIVTLPYQGLPLVEVFDGRTGTLERSFWAFPAGYGGAVSMVLDPGRNGQGYSDILAVTQMGSQYYVVGFDGRTGQQLASVKAFDPNFLGGNFVG